MQQIAQDLGAPIRVFMKNSDLAPFSTSLKKPGFDLDLQLRKQRAFTETRFLGVKAYARCPTIEYAALGCSV